MLHTLQFTIKIYALSPGVNSCPLLNLKMALQKSGTEMNMFQVVRLYIALKGLQSGPLNPSPVGPGVAQKSVTSYLGKKHCKGLGRKTPEKLLFASTEQETLSFVSVDGDGDTECEDDEKQGGHQQLPHLWRRHNDVTRFSGCWLFGIFDKLCVTSGRSME